MQENRTKYISLCALLSIVTLHAQEERVVTPLFTIRSQGFNSVRRLPGEIDEIFSSMILMLVNVVIFMANFH